jgi:formamidopyrimidine-DNA glycosylase
MPELPEVEIVRRGLERVLVGAQIARLDQRRPDLRFALPAAFAARLEGQRIMRVGRRAKYLEIALDGGEVLIIHLGMSGRLTVAAPGAERGLLLGEYAYETGALAAHDHVVFTLHNGARVTYNDPRRFGFMLLMGADAWQRDPLCARIGPEPLTPQFDAVALAKAAHNRRTALKAFLLDQHVVAGLGNIYVSEALHLAELSPRRLAATLAGRDGRPGARAERLVDAIKAVLTAAIDAGGSSLRDYRHTDGSSGAFQEAFAVYGRDGAACTRPGCHGVVRRTVQTQRATFACGTCQR